MVPRGELVEVPLAGVDGEEVLPFPIYIRPHPDRDPVLFSEGGTRLGEARLERLHASGLSTFFVPLDRLGAYYSFLEESLDRNLEDPSVPLEEKCRVLHQVVTHAARSFLKTLPDKNRLDRMLRLLDSTTRLAWRETEALRHLRRMVEGDPTLAGHSVAVSLYSLGMGLRLFPEDLGRVGELTWAAFLHDIGRVPREPGKEDPLPPGTILGAEGDRAPDYTHTTFGAGILRELGLPEGVVRAAGEHHERLDGSGAPQGLKGEDIHPFAQAVALANVFDHIRSSHRGFLGIFETFRILIQSFPGCFAPSMVEAFLHTFGSEGGRRP